MKKFSKEGKIFEVIKRNFTNNTVIIKKKTSTETMKNLN